MGRGLISYHGFMENWVNNAGLTIYGLIEEVPSPEGPVYVLTDLGLETPEFGAA